MARKKEIKKGFYLKYLPCGRMKELVELADGNPFIKDKDVALCKYVETLSSIVEKFYFYNSKKKQKYFAISQRILNRKLGVRPNVTSKILKDLVAKKFIRFNAKDFQTGVVSYKYQPIFSKIESVIFFKNSLTKKNNEMFAHEYSEKDFYLTPDLMQYRKSIMKITFDNSIKGFINGEYKERCKKEIESIADKDVRKEEINILENSIYIFNLFFDGSNVPSNTLYQSLGILRPEFIPIINLLLEKYKVSRPVKDSRVYSNITNLKRCFRPFLRLNGLPLIGFDIANSQPLLAAIEFRKFSMEKYGYIKEDVLEYQKNCEVGKFYEYFTSLPELKEIDIENDEDVRSEFKGIFFGKIFYSKNIEQENFLKNKFKEKYPTCYEAIFFLKGDKNYSEDYKKFSALMTKLETEIMWTTNMEVINQGFDTVNVFDSLYSDSEEAVQLGKQLVLEKFKEFGITPTLKDIDYRKIKNINMKIEYTAADKKKAAEYLEKRKQIATETGLPSLIIKEAVKHIQEENGLVKANISFNIEKMNEARKKFINGWKHLLPTDLAEKMFNDLTEEEKLITN